MTKINAGVYLFKRSFLQKAISNLKQHGVTGELHLPDLIAQASEDGDRSKVLPLDEWKRQRGAA